MATYTEALEALGKIDGGEALIEAVRGEVSQKNREAQNLRERAKGLESKVRTLAGAEESEAIDAVLGKLEHGLKAGASSSDDRIKRLETSLDETRKALAGAESKRRETLVHSKVKDALAKGNAARPEDLLHLVAGKVKVGDDGETLSFLGDTGEAVDLEVGIGSWLKARPEFVRSPQQPGPGGSGTKNGPQAAKTITRAEYDRATRERDMAVINDVGAGKISISD